MHFGRGLAALAIVAAAAEAATATCDVSALSKCSQITRPMLPNAPSPKVKNNFCKYAVDYYSCADNAGCMTAVMAKECTAEFMLAQCSGSEICKPSSSSSSKSGGSSTHSSGKEPSPSPSTPAAPVAPVVEDQFNYEKYPPHAPFFGFMGAAFALIFANLGAAYGTAKSGRGISTMGVVYPSLIMKHIIPVVMAGVLGIYGLIIAVIIGSSVTAFKNGEPVYSAFKGFAHLGGGLACGLSGLAAGLAIGVVGDYGVRSAAEQPKLYVGMVLVLIFSEALGLYGLIVGLILTSKE